MPLIVSAWILLVACAPNEPQDPKAPHDSEASPDTGDAIDTADTGDSAPPDDTADTDTADTAPPPDTGTPDADGDGYPAGLDCDDTDADVFPGATETCDEADEDCDGEVDDACIACTVTVPGDAASIQEGIDRAAVGGVVCVGPGTWVENIDFHGAEVTVLGLRGAEETTIDGGGCCDHVPAVQFASAEPTGTVLRGFTITDAVTNDHGGGIRISGASPTLEDLVVTGNYAWDWSGGGGGGGIYVVDGDPSLQNIVVSHNEGLWNWENEEHGLGGGIYLERSDAVLQDVTIEGNSAGNGGGLYLKDSNAVLANVRIEGNRAGDVGGGGIFLDGGSPTLTNVFVTSNLADAYWYSSDGGGIYDVGSTATLTNVLVSGNSASDDGGGIYVDGGAPAFVNAVVHDNGDGVRVATGTATFRYSDLYDGIAGVDDPTNSDGNVSVDPVPLSGGHLDASSPLVDAGDPGIVDPDGSRSDMGAFGGPGAASWDLDGDGFSAWWRPGPWDAATSPGADCDDGDAGVYPGAGC